MAKALAVGVRGSCVQVRTGSRHEQVCCPRGALAKQGLFEVKEAA